MRTITKLKNQLEDNKKWTEFASDQFHRQHYPEIEIPYTQIALRQCNRSIELIYELLAEFDAKLKKYETKSGKPVRRNRRVKNPKRFGRWYGCKTGLYAIQDVRGMTKKWEGLERRK
jgi:hypothetical protein